MALTLSNQATTEIHQCFILCSEESWLKQKAPLSKSVSNFFQGKKGQYFVTNQGEMPVYLIGLGDDVKNFEIQQIANRFTQLYRDSFQEVTSEISADFLDGLQIGEFIKGLFLGAYNYPFNYQHTFWKPGFHLICKNLKEKSTERIINITQALCEGQFAAMEWLNKPNNYKSVHAISDFIKNLSEKYDFKQTIFNREQAKEKGLGAFVAVNQGSSMDCAFTVLEYQGGGKDSKTVGFVGKCVLFDTGGISLKNSQNLHYMKSDLGGAMGILGALIAVAELQLPINIVAVFPITDNAIGSKAYVPSDVVTAYNGKTIEILNTDAEGRLTLSDGLAYLTKNYKTDVLIDMATLTGAVVRMFGETSGALFTNNSELKNKLITAGEQTHQRLWNLPLWSDWEEEIKSEVADFKNISMKPIGDCFVAAKLLEQFIERHPCWAHIDMAAMAFGTVNYSKEKAATGFGVQLFLRFIKNFIKNN